MNCTKRFVPMKRYFDYFTTFFFKREGFGISFLGGRRVNWGSAVSENVAFNAIQWFWFRKGSSGVFRRKTNGHCTTLKQLLIRVRKMSELGSIRVIILVYTGQTDLKQIVSQNNKMILFYFHGSVKHFNIVNACSVVDLIILKAEPDC